MKIALRLKESISIPIEAETITPDNFDGKNKDEISSLSVWYGNKEEKIGSMFDISIEDHGGDDVKIVLGDVPRVKRIGERMSNGEIVINGDVDMHCGAFMSGGRIEVKGNADSWAGREMSGGELIIEGNAGHYLGGAYRGEMKGMTGGKIMVKGNAGDYVGDHLTVGEIEINGNAGILAGLHMEGGRITIGDDATMPGGEMRNGEIIVKGNVFERLPSFRYEGTEELDGVGFDKYIGDLAPEGKGKGILYIKK
jgi:formylmethanofuran dehydrogenase subunit C